eukprot:6214139-Pleurochrysis_carterae.AAC.5
MQRMQTKKSDGYSYHMEIHDTYTVLWSSGNLPHLTGHLYSSWTKRGAERRIHSKVRYSTSTV